MMLKGAVVIEEIDDHLIHLDEHTRYVLSEYGSLNEKQKERFYAHIREHKQIQANNEKEKMNDYGTTSK